MEQTGTLGTMITAVQNAGARMEEDFATLQNRHVTAAELVGFVEAADQRCAQDLQDTFATAQPTYGMLIEGRDAVPGTDGAHRWIVDPMDGTGNFLRGLAHWAISVALEHNGEIVAGVVYDPVRKDLFVAERGSGAWLNGDIRLHTSGKSRLSEAMLSTGMPPGGSQALPQALTQYQNVLTASAGVRQLGAAALDLAYVAAGRLDGYWNRHLDPWHFAAGQILIEEAGGRVAALQPETGRPEKAGLGEAGLVGIAADLYPGFMTALTTLNER